MKEDIPILEHLINENNNLEIIFLNGNTVVSKFKKYFNSKITLKKEYFDYISKKENKTRKTVYFGNYKNKKILGWSPYLKYIDANKLYLAINGKD